MNKIKCPKCLANIEITVNLASSLPDLRLIVDGWKELMGVPLNDAEWDRVYIPMLIKDIKSFLSLFGGNTDIALNCMDSIMKSFRDNGYPIKKFKTLLEHAGEWRKDYLEKQAKAVV